jgi:hypothetical protein
MREALERGFASPTIFVIDASCDYRHPTYNLAKSVEEMG